MQKDNLTFKKITEFTSDDTIYIRKSSEGTGELFLCQFISFQNGRVTGKMLQAMTNPRLYTREIEQGKELTAPIASCALYGKAPGDDNSHYHWVRPDGTFAKNSNKVTDNDDHVQEHESYGMITLSRGQGHPKALFGSSIEHPTTITLCINTAEHTRSLNNDRYYGKKNIIEVELSQAQFAEMITNINTEGTPCTIRKVMGARMENPEFKSKVSQFQNEFKNKMHNLSEDINSVIEDAVEILENKKTVNKGDREHILSAIKQLTMQLKSNMPFINEQFTEQMEGVVVEAKASIEAFMQEKIRQAGITGVEGMSADQLFLGDKKED